MKPVLNPYSSSTPLPQEEEEVFNCYIHIPELENKGWIVISRIGFTVNHYKDTTLAVIYLWTKQSQDWDWIYQGMLCFDKVVSSDDIMHDIVAQNDLDIIPMRHDYFCKKYNFSPEDETLLALQLGEARKPKDLSAQFQPSNLAQNVTTQTTGESNAI